MTPAVPSQVIAADLYDKADLARVEQVLRTDAAITRLVNNAGVGAPASLLDSDIDQLNRMIDLNVIALVRLTYAIVPAFVQAGQRYDHQHGVDSRHRARSA